MIERIKGCLENGGRGLIRAPKKHLHSRRHLHSAFWSHGAGNIDLPAWWILFLQTTEPPQAGQHVGSNRSISGEFGSGIQRFFLDFLYPFRTRALIKRLNQSTIAHRRAAETARQQCRQYTFLAENLVNEKLRRRIVHPQESRASRINSELMRIIDNAQTPEDQQLEDVIEIESEEAEHLKILEQTVEHILQDDKIVDFEHLWTCFGEMAHKSEALGYQYLEKVFFRMSSSQHQVDALHSLELFEAIPKASLTKEHHTHAAAAAIVSKSTNTALAQIRTIFDIYPSSILTDVPEVFSLAFNQEEWPVAIEIWYKFWQSPLLYHTSSRELWTYLNEVPVAKLAPLATSAVRFILSLWESFDDDLRGMASEFAIQLAERVFDKEKFPNEPSIYNNFLGGLRQLLGSDALQCFEDAFFRLQSVDDKSYDLAALAVFEDLRELTSYKPSSLMLDIVLKIVRSIRSEAGAIMVLEDYRRHGLKISTFNYNILAEILAHAGQTEQLESLFQDFLREGTPTDDEGALHRQKMFNFQLYVLFKNGQVDEIQRRFEQLQTDYGFVPNCVSYNFVIMAFVDARDDANMLRWYQKMEDKSVRPDCITYATIMGFYASKGDIDAVEDWLEKFEGTGMQMDVNIIDTLVMANVNERRLDIAEEYVRQATREHPRADLTHMWNILLEFYALSKNSQKVFSLQREMQEAGVREDSGTYTTLFLTLCQMSDPDLIYAFFRSPSYDNLGIPRTAVQYALIMSCYIRTNKPHRVKVLYQEMLERKVMPDATIFHALLQAAIKQDEIDGTTGDPNLSHAQKVLDLTVKFMDSVKLGSLVRLKSAMPMTRTEAFLALPFSSMISIYGAAGAFEEVTTLFNRYVNKAIDLGHRGLADMLPMTMLIALMVTHRKANDREEMDKCWRLALEQAERSCRRQGADLTEAGWVLRPRRFDMNRALNPYMEHLAENGSIDDLIRVIDNIRRAGFKLSNSRMNSYVSHLASSPRPSHQYLAFELTERELLQSWGGWKELVGRDTSIKKQFWRKFRDGLRKPGFKHPSNKTFVQLAAVYMDARSGAQVSDDTLSRQRLIRIAPKTVNAILNMPRMDDQSEEQLRRR